MRFEHCFRVEIKTNRENPVEHFFAFERIGYNKPFEIADIAMLLNDSVPWRTVRWFIVTLFQEGFFFDFRFLFEYHHLILKHINHKCYIFFFGKFT